MGNLGSSFPRNIDMWREILEFGGKFCIFVHINTIQIGENWACFPGNKHFFILCVQVGFSRLPAQMQVTYGALSMVKSWRYICSSTLQNISESIWILVSHSIPKSMPLLEEPMEQEPSCHKILAIVARRWKKLLTWHIISSVKFASPVWDPHTHPKKHPVRWSRFREVLFDLLWAIISVPAVSLTWSALSMSLLFKTDVPKAA